MFNLPIPNIRLPWRHRPPEALAATRPATSSPLRTARHWDLRGGIPLGRDTTGQYVSLPVTGGPVLIDGAPGAGRTNTAQNIAVAAALDPDARLVVAAAKPSGWGPFSLTADHFVAGTDTAAIAGLAGLLTGAVTDIENRVRRRHNGTLSELAPVVIVIDDAHLYLRHPDHGREIAQLLSDIAATGRFAHYLLALTFTPVRSSIPVDLRARFANRLTLGHRRSHLGQPGCALLTIANGTPTEVDVSYITRNDMALLVERARTARASAGTLTRRPVFDFDDPDATLWVFDPKAGTDFDLDGGGDQ